jgi:hypothetical protein
LPSIALVTLRITQVETEEGTLLQVDGRLDAESLGELDRACKTARLPLTLNLEGVLWIDDRAAETLWQLKADGTVMTNASPYVNLRIKNGDEKSHPPITEGGEL